MLIQYVGPFRAVQVVPENGRPIRVRNGEMIELPYALALALTRSADWQKLDDEFPYRAVNRTAESEAS